MTIEQMLYNTELIVTRMMKFCMYYKNFCIEKDPRRKVALFKQCRTIYRGGMMPQRKIKIYASSPMTNRVKLVHPKLNRSMLLLMKEFDRTIQAISRFYEKYKTFSSADLKKQVKEGKISLDKKAVKSANDALEAEVKRIKKPKTVKSIDKIIKEIA